MNRFRGLLGRDGGVEGDEASHSSSNELSSKIHGGETADGTLEGLEIKAQSFDPNLPGTSSPAFMGAHTCLYKFRRKTVCD